MQSQKDTICFQPIGFIQSDFHEKFGTPRQGLLAPHSLGVIELLPAWQNQGLFDGLDQFSHVWLVTYFHRNDNQSVQGKIHPPRLNGEKIGVLASRSPHRPNPIGLTLAEIVSVDSNKLTVSGIDLISGTPVLDIKPYLLDGDRPENSKGGWTDFIQKTSIPSHWSSEALADLNDERVRKLIDEMLALDPRPQPYRNRQNEIFAVWVAGHNVLFRYNHGIFEVMRVTSEREDLEALRRTNQSEVLTVTPAPN